MGTWRLIYCKKRYEVSMQTITKYTVTEQMIVDGIMEMEAYDEKIR